MLSVQQTNNSPSFKQISIVRVPKKAFKNPEKLTNCTLEFGDVLDKVSGNENSLLRDLVSALFGNSKEVKTAHNLESNLSVRFTDVPLQEDYHTFSVFTGEDKDRVVNMCSLKNAVKTIGELEQNGTHKNAKEILINSIRELCVNKNIQEFKIESLDKLIELKSKLGL